MLEQTWVLLEMRQLEQLWLQQPAAAAHVCQVSESHLWSSFNQGGSTAAYTQ